MNNNINNDGVKLTNIQFFGEFHVEPDPGDIVPVITAKDLQPGSGNDYNVIDIPEGIDISKITEIIWFDPVDIPLVKENGEKIL